MGIKEYESPEGCNEFCLAMDLGATNMNIAIGCVESRPKIIFTTHYKSQETRGVEDAINDALKVAKEKYNIEVTRACLAIAGPMDESRKTATPTNIDWNVNIEKVKEKTGLKDVSLLNDFEAIAYGVECLKESDFEKIKDGDVKEKEPLLIIGPGTGLGTSIMVYDKCASAYRPVPSEGGHTDFPVRDEEEFKLMEDIKRMIGKKTSVYEEFVSGRGIFHIYEAIKDKHGSCNEVECAEEAEKPVRTSQSDCAVCRKAMEIFVRFTARYARNNAVLAVARGGVYVAGGIAANNLKAFTSGIFTEEFTSHDYEDFAKMLKDMPVKIIKNYDVSLYGALNFLKK